MQKRKPYFDWRWSYIDLPGGRMLYSPKVCGERIQQHFNIKFRNLVIMCVLVCQLSTVECSPLAKKGKTFVKMTVEVRSISAGESWELGAEQSVKRYSRNLHRCQLACAEFWRPI